MTPRRLIETYVNGWRKNDIDIILSSLSSDCVIIESHGPVYRGHNQVKKWLEYWISEKGKVTKWDITSYYLLDDKQTAFFEWSFKCKVSGKRYELDGISIVKFKKGKISFIHEYRMTKAAYEWREEELKSE